MPLSGWNLSSECHRCGGLTFSLLPGGSVPGACWESYALPFFPFPGVMLRFGGKGIVDIFLSVLRCLKEGRLFFACSSARTAGLLE